MANPSREARNEIERQARQAGIHDFEIVIRKPTEENGPHLIVAINPKDGKPIPEINPVAFHPTAGDYCVKFTGPARVGNA